MPIRNRNVPETVGPIRPVAWCRAEWSFVTLPLRPRMPSASPIASRKTIDRMAEREEEADAQRPLAVGHQLAGRVVDGGDVIGIEGVAHPERVGRDADADAEDAGAELEVLRRDEPEQQSEADDVQGDDDEREHSGAPPFGGRERARQPRPSRNPCRHRRCGHRTVPPGSSPPADPASRAIDCPGRPTASALQVRTARNRPPPRPYSSGAPGRFGRVRSTPFGCEASGSGGLIARSSQLRCSWLPRLRRVRASARPRRGESHPRRPFRSPCGRS